jgi:hypothetical protein
LLPTVLHPHTQTVALRIGKLLERAPLGLESFENPVAAAAAVAAEKQMSQAPHYLLFQTTHLLVTMQHSACPWAAWSVTGKEG